MNRIVALMAVAAALALASPASEAQSVSKGVAKTLAAAQTASKSRRWGECLGKLRDAEGSGGLTAYDQFIINELRGYCALSSGDNGTAIRAYEANLGSQYATNRGARVKALMQLNYNTGNYARAIEYGRQAQKGGCSRSRSTSRATTSRRAASRPTSSRRPSAAARPRGRTSCR